MADSPSAGYDIGVSASTALSNATPQTSDSGTVFNFTSPGASGDLYDQTQEATPTSTAVATTKSPGSSTDVGGADTAAGMTSPGITSGISPIVYVIAAAGIVAIIAVVLIIKHK